MMETKIVSVSYSYKIAITKLGKTSETDQFLKELLKSGHGREIAFSLRTLPYYIPYHFDAGKAFIAMATLESVGNEIVIFESESISKTNGPITMGENGETRTIYKSKEGFIKTLRKDYKESPLFAQPVV